MQTTDTDADLDFNSAVREHTPATVPTDPWGAPCCTSCTYTHNVPIPWPCTPLLRAADVVPAPTGWHITALAA
ncbi:hypothetical protein ACWC5I_28040 [Kitasatospora sp. NPDC001574]